MPRSLSRRTLLLGTSILASSVCVARSASAMGSWEGAAASGADKLPATLILSQERWSTGEVDNTVAPIVKTAIDHLETDTTPSLLLLPPAETDWDDVPEEDDVFDVLADLAEDHGIYLASAATIGADDSGKTETVGFVISPDGELLARIPKVTPDFTNGFTDSASRLSEPADIPVIFTPFGKLGMLVGEDLLVPGLVRSAMLSGVELLLNPATLSASNSALTARQELPSTLAYENWFLVATATPAIQRNGTTLLRLPTVTGLYDWQGGKVTATADQSFLTTPVDINVLRRGRAHISVNRYDNYPLILRDGVYGPVYSHIAARRGTPKEPETRKGWREEAGKRIAAQAARRTPDNQLLNGYYALMAQPVTMSPLPKAGRREALNQNITDALAMVEGRSRRADSKLVVFPEFCFSGAGYRTIEDILSASVRLPGPELELLSEFAQRHSIYVAGQFLEEDEKFPNRVFNTAFLLNDSGDLINKHRKVQCVDVIGTLRDHTPGSVFERYVEEFGIDSLFTVADTPLGKLAHIICFEIIFPEISRLMALKGAELIIQSTAEGWGSFRPMWNACRRKRAYENTAYLVMSNKGYDPSKPAPWVPFGESQFIDYRGDVRDTVTHNGPEVLQAYIDMKALRAARRNPATNIPIWDEPATYMETYLANHAVPNDLWTGDPFVFPYKDGVHHRAVLERFYERGVYERPTDPAAET